MVVCSFVVICQLSFFVVAIMLLFQFVHCFCLLVGFHLFVVFVCSLFSFVHCFRLFVVSLSGIGQNGGLLSYGRVPSSLRFLYVVFSKFLF